MKIPLKTLLVAGVVAVVAQANAVQYTVDAYANSSSGGTGVGTVMLDAGDWFSISVSPTDLWNAGALPRWSNANGLTGNLYATGSDESGQPSGILIGRNFGLWTVGSFSAPYGALVGQVGGGSFFFVGTSFNGQAANSGQLFLYYWDSNYSDNSERVTINADIQNNRVPEGGLTIALLATGLLGLAGLRRKV